jgi:hypothetical protein
MHQQFYYQLQKQRGKATQGKVHPLIALDQSKSQVYPLPQGIVVKTQQELDDWVLHQLSTQKLSPTTRAHLEVGHSQPGLRQGANHLAEWLLYAEAFLRQERHRKLIGDRPEQVEAWRDWLQNQHLDVKQLPASVHDYFSDKSTGYEVLALMQESPSLEWNTALMVCMNPTCKVDPAGKSHETGALQRRVMANQGHYGWTLSYSVTHLDYSPIDGLPDAKDAQGNILDLGLDGKDATAVKMASMAQKNEHGIWKERPTNLTESAGAWFDRMLLTLRHNKDIKHDILQGIVNTAIEAGIPHTQIIRNELPKTAFVGSGVSKAILEVVTGQSWDRIGEQVQVLEGLGYKDELPIYLWLYFKNAPQESYALPSLS